MPSCESEHGGGSLRSSKRLLRGQNAVVVLLVIGSLGAIGYSAAPARSFEVLARSGRHPIAALVTTSWRDEARLNAAVEAFRPSLVAIGFEICRRKAGWRLA